MTAAKQPNAIVHWLDGRETNETLRSHEFAWLDYGDGLGFGWMLRVRESPLTYRELECGRLTSSVATKGEGS